MGLFDDGKALMFAVKFCGEVLRLSYVGVIDRFVQFLQNFTSRGHNTLKLGLQ